MKFSKLLCGILRRILVYIFHDHYIHDYVAVQISSSLSTNIWFFFFAIFFFSSDLFQKLFRQDLLVASLFRNYLLAERIMRSYDCTPVSCPKLPSTFQHPMWQAWDLSLDLCLSQLPAVLECEESYCHSPFFEEQLTAFEVWLDMGSDQRSPPEQLPIVLQVSGRAV